MRHTPEVSMQRIIPFLLLALCAASSAYADEGPRLQVENKELDFGIIMHGQLAHVKVPLTNAGDAPLLLKRVKPSCGCTVASHPESIAPGATADLELTFDSGERPAGYQSFRIAIYTNDPTQRDLGGYCTLLSLRGEVKTVYRVAPHGAYFGEMIRGLQDVEKTIMVTGKESAAAGFSAKLRTQLPEYLQVKISPLPATAERKGVEVRVKLLSSLAPLGQVDMSLDFETNITQQPVFRVMVAALINQRIAGPPAVHFGVVERAKGAQRVVPLERRDGLNGIPVAKLRYDSERFSITHKTISEQRVELEIDVKTGAPPGPYAGTIDVFLDDPNQPMVRVPVYVRVAPSVAVEPPVVLLPKALESGQTVVTLEVRPRGGEVTAVQVEPAGAFSATLQGQTLVLRASRAGAPAPGRLILTTTVAGEEHVEVPLITR